MKFYVYQFAVEDHLTLGNFTDRAVEREWFNASRGNVSWETFQEKFKCVCAIEANDLDEVFHIGNVGPEEKIERFGDMTSVSVGNIIQANGRYMIVKPFGFEEITNKIAA